ncbi:hypothetical protein [Endozoicomonas lisbonensis]|uniref:DUF1353 domain-containing protein n=1 Tax=Endozoicomonas lisbonensis TaxID=3120522 RepID=A0ABV2SAY5_9GAMM
MHNTKPNPQPRKTQRTGNFPYRFKITTDYTCESGWQLPEAFDSKWLSISTTGRVTVKANDNGYAWDGCTPKKSVLNLWIIGVPDGHINHRTMKPYTYYASLVHDALYQYLDTVPVSKKNIDRLFLSMLGDFKLRFVYYGAVRLFGGRGVKQHGLRKQG